MVYIVIQLINNENILDDWASQMRKYHRNETVMIYLIIMYIFIDLIASYLLPLVKPFICQLIYMYFDQKPHLTAFCHYVTACAQLLVLCNYVTVYLEMGQRSRESTFTLSSDTFD